MRQLERLDLSRERRVPQTCHQSVDALCFVVCRNIDRLVEVMTLNVAHRRGLIRRDGLELIEFGVQRLVDEPHWNSRLRNDLEDVLVHDRLGSVPARGRQRAGPREKQVTRTREVVVGDLDVVVDSRSDP
jgi:hypothetical protein